MTTTLDTERMMDVLRDVQAGKIDLETAKARIEGGDVRRMTIEEAVTGIMDGCLDDDMTAIDFQWCDKVLRSNPNWNGITGVDAIRESLQSSLKIAITDIVKKYKALKSLHDEALMSDNSFYDELACTVSTGCWEVRASVDEVSDANDDEYIDVDVKFCPQWDITCIKLKDFAEINEK